MLCGDAYDIVLCWRNKDTSLTTLWIGMDGKKATRRNWANGDNKDIVLYFDCVAYMYFPDCTMVEAV